MSRSAVLVLVLLLACPQPKDTDVPIDTDADTDADADGDTDADTDCVADHTDSLGMEPTFDLPASHFTFTTDSGFARLEGAVYAAASSPDFHHETQREGACRLLTFTPSTCSPLCEYGLEACIDGVCVPYPPSVSAGDITLSAPGLGSVSVPPLSIGPYYWDGAFEIDDGEVRIDAPGDTVEAFSVHSCVTRPPTPTGDWSALFAARAPGEDVTLTWSDPTAGARVTLRMTTGVGTHGGISPVEVECEAPDTGSLVIHGPFLDSLFDPIYWSCGECGSFELHRYRAGQTTTSVGPVQLRTQATAPFFFIP